MTALAELRERGGSHDHVGSEGRRGPLQAPIGGRTGLVELVAFVPPDPVHRDEGAVLLTRPHDVEAIAPFGVQQHREQVRGRVSVHEHSQALARGRHEPCEVGAQGRPVGGAADRHPLEAEVDELFAHGQNGLTRADRAKDYFKVQEILARDLPVLNLHQQAEIDATTSKLKDVFLTANYVWWGSVWMAE